MTSYLEPVPEVPEELEGAGEGKAHQGLLQVRGTDGGDGLADVLARRGAHHEHIDRERLEQRRQQKHSSSAVCRASCSALMI